MMQVLGALNEVCTFCNSSSFSANQLRVLFYIMSHGQTAMMDVTRYMKASKATIADAVSVLERKHGLLAREEEGIYLTPRGIRLKDSIQNLIRVMGPHL